MFFRRPRVTFSIRYPSPRRRAVSDPTRISPSRATSARRAARLVTGPLAVKVQRVPRAPSKRVEPTHALPELIPMWMPRGRWGARRLRASVTARSPSAVSAARRAWVSAAPSWKTAMKPSPAVSVMSPAAAWIRSRKVEK